MLQREEVHLALGVLLFFGLLTVIVIGAAMMVVMATKPVHSAIYLVVNLLGVAVLYLTLSAEFLTAVQVLVYAGAIMVLFLFVITLLNPAEGEAPDPIGNQAVVGLVLAFVLLGQVAILLLAGVLRSPFAVYPPPEPTWGDNIQAVGTVLFTAYLLPFEVVSILLLAAIVGATVITRPGSRGQQ